MKYIEGESRNQQRMLPDCLDDYIAEERAINMIGVKALIAAM